MDYSCSLKKKKEKKKSVTVIRFSTNKKRGERESLVELHIKDSFGTV